MALAGRRPRRLFLRWMGAVLLAAGLLPLAASAQEVSLQLRLRRTFGYSGGRDIQGSFLLTAEGPDGLQQVTFYVDDEILENVGAPPFQARLHTGDFPLGEHKLWAEGMLDDGSLLRSNEIAPNFVEASAGGEFAVRILTPILAVLGLVFAGAVALAAVSSRRHKPGVYGSAGGAVCPRCNLPMSRHFLAPNLGSKKLERCPHCGKWARVSRASTGELAAAEARFLGKDAPEVTPAAQAEALRRQVDDSRFFD